MALSRQQLNALYRKTFNRDVDESGLATYSPFNDEASVEKDLLKSQEYALRQKANNTANPVASSVSPQRQQLLSATSINPLSTAELEAFRQQSEQAFNPLRQASQERLAKFKEQAAQEQRDLETRLREQANLDVQGLEQGLQNRGLLYSGGNVVGQSRIRENVNRDISRSAVQRALQESERVLQEAQNQASIDQQVAERAGKLAEQEFGRRKQGAEAARYSLDVMDSEAEREFKLQQQELARQQAELERQSALNKVQEVDLGDRVALIDPFGNVVSEYKKGKLPSSAGSEKSGFDPVLASLLGFQQGQASLQPQFAPEPEMEVLTPQQERKLRTIAYGEAQAFNKELNKKLAENPKSQARREANLKKEAAQKVQPPKPKPKATTTPSYLPSTTPAWLANRGKR